MAFSGSTKSICYVGFSETASSPFSARDIENHGEELRAAKGELSSLLILVGSTRVCFGLALAVTINSGGQSKQEPSGFGSFKTDKIWGLFGELKKYSDFNVTTALALPC